ncbi:MAG: sulfatase-like hydrolase/transferase [Verrucomicrobia bacterium]|nr:sulfatase-like hydrolase/transferase [Verrucomicrobiota bacterium]
MTFLSLTLILLGVADAPAAPEGPRKPNIVLIISDDHGWTDYGFMGHPQVQTPRLDKLASESLVFRRGYVPSSLCCPSLAAIVTGLYPHQTKVCCNDPPLPKAAVKAAKPGKAGKAGKAAAGRADPAFIKQAEEMSRFLDGQPALPRELGKTGYLSLQTGKWWQGHFSTAGFTHGMSAKERSKGGRHGDEGLKIGRETMQPIYDFIEQAGDKPWFVWYAPMLPHQPHNPPQRLLDKYTPKTPSSHIAKYWAMIEWFDETCGQLLDYLDQKKLADNTLVAYVTDNGWIQQTDAAPPRSDSKLSQYDGGLRTPIMIRWPGRVKPRQSDTPVISIDLAPTLLRACGLQPAAAMQGVNLLDDEAVKSRAAIFGECFTHNAVDIHSPATSLCYRWCIADGRWKLIIPNPANVTGPKKPGRAAEVELYDLIADPREETNLAAAQPDRVGQLTKRIDGWWAAKP